MASGKIEKIINGKNNYCKMPDGTLIQYDTVAFLKTAVGRQDVTVNFKIPFVSYPKITISWNDNAGAIFNHFKSLTTINITPTYFLASGQRTDAGYDW